jgi:hypothetical protein
VDDAGVAGMRGCWESGILTWASRQGLNS